MTKVKYRWAILLLTLAGQVAVVLICSAQDLTDRQRVAKTREILEAPFPINKFTSRDKVDSIYRTIKEGQPHLPSTELSIKALEYLCLIKVVTGDYDSAKFYNGQIPALLELIDTPSQSLTFEYYRRLGAIYKNLGDYSNSLNVYQESLSLVKNPTQLGTIYQNIGYLNELITDFEEALGYFKQAYSTRLSAGLKDKAAASAERVAGAYYNLGEYDSTLHWFSKVETLHARPITLAWLSCSKSRLHLTLGQLHEADSVLAYIYPTVKNSLKQELKQEFWLLAGNILSRDSLKLLSTTLPGISAAQALDSAIHFSLREDHILPVIQTKQEAASVFAAMGNHVKAYRLNHEATMLEQNAYRQSRKETFDLQVKLTEAKAEEAITAQKLETSIKDTQVRYLIALAVLMLVILIIFLWNQRRLAMLNNRLKAQHTAITEQNTQLKTQHQRITEQEQQITHLRQEQLSPYTDFIKADLSAITTSRLADHFHMSNRTLYRKIKSLSDMTPDKFIQQVKLEEALSQFEKAPHLNVAEVGYAVGFKDAAHFSKAFKARYDLSPSGYIQMLREQEQLQKDDNIESKPVKRTEP